MSEREYKKNSVWGGSTMDGAMTLETCRVQKPNSAKWINKTQQNAAAKI